MNSKYRDSYSVVRQTAAVLSIATLLAGTFAVGISAQSMKAETARKAGKLNEDQRVLHVLNRLGFGARPGDVERVKAMGVDNYIMAQLDPSKIDDSATEAKLQNLETLRHHGYYQRIDAPTNLSVGWGYSWN